MSIQAVKDYLEKFGFAEKVEEFQESSATVELAAQAAGVLPAMIAKTLSFQAGDHAILVVASGDAKVSNRKYKDYFGRKAKMLTLKEALEYTGHEVGGICPYANPEGKTKVYLDVSMKRFPVALPAAGSANSCVRLTVEELERSCPGARWVDVCVWDT
jgi:prolyl-tRNA editing enzyme YbaK/EbsC (Cys-tRNA(Pro) deacylase)